MTIWIRVVRWMRTVALAVVFLYSFYAFIFGADLKLPGSRWIYVGVASLVLALVLIGGFIFDRAGLYWVLQALGFEQPLKSQVRRLEYQKVVQNMNWTLHRFKQENELKDNELRSIEYLWPADETEDVQECCKEFARRGKNDPDAKVLELLYRGSRNEAENTRQLWNKDSDSHKKKLARILVDSKQVDGFGDTEQTVSALEWIFGRIHYFDVELVKSEIRVLVNLWRHLKDFAKYLGRSEVSKVIPDLSSLKEFNSLLLYLDGEFKARDTKLLSQTKDDVLVDLIAKRGKEWIAKRGEESISDWDKTLSTAAESLAIVGLGISIEETGDIRSPLLSCLSVSIAKDQNALDVQFGYLWRKSKQGSDISATADLSALAGWAKSVDDAKRVMGEEISTKARRQLQYELAKGRWLTWLPIQTAIAQLVKQSQENYDCLQKLVSAQDRDDIWKRDLKELADRIGMNLDLASTNLETLLEMVGDALNKKYAIPNCPTPTTPQEVEAAINHLAAKELRPETKLVGYLVKYQTVLDTLGLFRERTADLTRQLYELGNDIEAEAAGGSAYLVTFDQTRGPLADLIGLLKTKYDLKPYTRYSRIGKLNAGRSFESFYREFEADLEELIEAATDSNFEKRLNDVGSRMGANDVEIDRVVSALAYAHKERGIYPDWEQVEITVQQFSCVHRHDFIRDAKFPEIPGRDISEDFKIPPTPEVSVQELGL